MNLFLVGWNYRTAPVALRERLALPEPRLGPTLTELLTRFGGKLSFASPAGGGLTVRVQAPRPAKVR